MRKLSVFISCLSLGSMALTAVAQDKKPDNQPPAGDRPARGDRPGPGGQGGGMGRQALSPEKSKAAWELQASAFGKHHGLNEGQTKALIGAYVASRESQQAAMEKLRKEMRDAGDNSGGGGGGGGGGRGAMGEKMQELNKAEQDKFRKALGSTLSAEQTEKAVAVLGVVNPTWDRAVDAIAELKLDAAKQQDALNATEAFIVALAKARQPGGDPQDMCAAMQDARENLTATLKKSLTDEQIAKIEATLGGRRPGGQGPGGDTNGPRRRPRDGGGGGGGGGL